MQAERALHVVSEVAKALDHAHGRNLVHRDVKPANFLLGGGDDDRVLLADFGIARAIDDTAGLTSTGMVVATLAYAAPETLSGDHVDGRADIYALGCSLYQMLTGQTPFANRGNLHAVMKAHLSDPPPRATDSAPNLPPTIDAVIATAMAKDPSQRFSNACELASAAATALHQATQVSASAPPSRPIGHAPPGGVHLPGGYSAEHQTTARTSPTTRPTWWRHPRWIALTASVAVLVAAASAGGIFLRRDSQPESIDGMVAECVL
ncbi:serine/threonine-protein kinase [Mycolicibacillus trivialis]|uniref:serine/threonine-protein kinase n=1 Tax=Mycolicibacillus trivialis TaxID=1798 RepID=UPI003558A431